MSTPEGAVPNFADAAAATRNLINEANAEPAAAPQEQYPVTEPAVETQAPAETIAPDPATQLSWDEIDFSRPLNEAEQRFVKDGYLRHSDYTRKTQEIAEQRRQFEQLGDPEAVQAAVEFTNSLQDPANLRQLQAEIAEHLASIGMGADQQASPTEHDTPGLDPATQARIDAMEQRFAQLEHTAQEAQLEAELTNKFQEAEDAIRRDYPQYSQQDIDKIYELSGLPDAGWDLFKAQEIYESWNSYFSDKLIGKKGNFPDAANNVRTGALVNLEPDVDMNSLAGAREASKRLFASE